MDNKIMRSIVFVAIFAVVTLSGCNTDRMFYDTVSANWAAIRPEYVGYIDKDTQRSAAEKRALMTTVDMFDAAVVEHGRLLDGQENPK